MAGSLMAHFHMSYKQLLWDTPWPVLQVMLADQPSYESDSDKDKEETVIQATKDDIVNFIKRKNKEI